MFPLQGCTLTEINVARQDIAKNRRGSIGNEKVLLPNYCKVVGADGIDTLAIQANDHILQKAWVSLLRQLIQVANARQSKLRVFDWRKVLTQASTSAALAVSGRALFRRVLQGGGLGEGGAGRGGGGGGGGGVRSSLRHSARGSVVAMEGSAGSRLVFTFSSSAWRDIRASVEEASLEGTGWMRIGQTLSWDLYNQLMPGDWIVGALLDWVEGGFKPLLRHDYQAVIWDALQASADNGEDRPFQLVVWRPRIADDAQLVQHTMHGLQADIKYLGRLSLRFEAGTDAVCFVHEAILNDKDGARVMAGDQLVGINFIPLEALVASAGADVMYATQAELLADLMHVFSTLPGGAVLNVLRQADERPVSVSAAMARGRAFDPERPSSVHLMQNFSDATLNRDSLQLFNDQQQSQDGTRQGGAAGRPKMGGRRVSTGGLRNDREHIDQRAEAMEEVPMTPTWMSHLPGKSYRRFTTGGLLVQEADGSEERRVAPTKPQRVTCMFGKNENVWEWIQLESKQGNGLVVSAVAEGARRRGVNVGDTLVECRSTSNLERKRAIPLTQLSDPEKLYHFAPMQPPLILVMWRTASPSALKSNRSTPSSKRHLGYKVVNIVVKSTLATSGLKLAQPSRDDARFQVAGTNPAAAENGFAVGDEVVGIDFTPLPSGVTNIKRLQQALASAKVRRQLDACARWCLHYAQCMIPARLTRAPPRLPCRW